ncbi:hypothetical protein ACEPPN_012222 [Leptodophora sp. 'Broadleaf-Isolate-01']
MAISSVDQELTHEMILELLAHQFAYPVKWIDTQDVILGKQEATRVIEVGPSNTLTVMAKRTIASKYKDRDQSKSVKRELLCTDENGSEIYYANGSVLVDPSHREGEKDSIDAPPQTAPVQTEVEVKPVQVSKSLNVGPAPVPDAPILAQDIVVSLVAQKLRKSNGEINRTSSIKHLVGGRSTLENEIVGDLINEFGVIPERAEEITITDLSDLLQTDFKGTLGKQTSMMIERMMSSKMPGGFSTSVARKYLQGRWGFSGGRQDAVLLASSVAPPPGRLATAEHANSYFDDKVVTYSSTAGISLNESSGSRGACVESSSLDPEAFRLLAEEQNSLARKQLELYASHLNLDLYTEGKAHDVSAITIQKLQGDLDLWNEEHGDFYAAGIRPMFSLKKVRHFDSWCNWAVQDVLSLFHDLVADRLESSSPEYHSQLARIVNRCNSKTQEVIQYFITKCQRIATDGHLRTQRVLESLLEECEQEVHRPMFKSGTTSPPRERRPGPPMLGSHQTVKRKVAGGWKHDQTSTTTYQEILTHITSTGLSFEGLNVLMTGAGVGSIGAEVLRGLLAGGAKVLVTTSSFSTETLKFYNDMYVSFGGPGSQLVVAPFNQGSQLDINAVLTYIYDKSKDGLGWDLDVVLPFAAISETGREIDKIDSRSELAHRIMLTNTIRLVGLVKSFKVNSCDSRPAQIILPLSANHGCFGGDGLYAESKLALESLFDKWRSESWCNYISICGVSIGWTRGTGLMSGNDFVACEIEKLGVQTFSQEEMAGDILALLSPEMIDICQSCPLFADLNGGLDAIEDLSHALATIRTSLKEDTEIREAIAKEDLLDAAGMLGQVIVEAEPDTLIPRSYIDLGFPTLPDYGGGIEALSTQLEGMVDLNTVAVITGFAELGPNGNSRTRWEMESSGAFSTEGCIEMAWIMGLIKYATNRQIKGEWYSGWVDAKSAKPIEDHQIKQRYEKEILAHSGIRLVEPALWGDGYDPHKKQLLQEVVIQADLQPFDASKDMAEAFVRQQGEFAEVSQIPGTPSEFKIRIKKGATLMIPKAIDFETDVAGQLPTGWDPRRYGISDDIISQVDPITLYTLVCTVEALLSSGISDPYEIYQFIHTSKLANCIGSGVGGVASASRMYKGRTMEKQVAKDVLQETFLNTVGAWVNMLLLSSNGPIRTPVGACATALESLDSAHDLITTGKAEMCLVGGVDDLEEHMTFEFANMKATSNSALERESGRSPSEMSRPTASSRRGFMESQGCGIQVVCTASLALKMGLPIYGILAFTGTSSDKVGRSVPAPGKGVMVNVQESRSAFPSPLLNISYRRRQLVSRRKQVEEFKEVELALLHDELEIMKGNRSPTSEIQGYQKYREDHIQHEAEREYAEALKTLGNSFWRNHPEISPIRGALATWGLTIDDLDVSSFHGTSTVKNEKNECDIMQRQLAHLGRSKGNQILGVFQKHLTGHPKGAAGAWMMNGCLQIMRTGLIPGNRNADNIDPFLEQFDLIAFPNKSIQTAGVKACSVFSFGFGQKGTQAICVHPKYLLAVLKEDEYRRYQVKAEERQEKANAHFHKAMTSGTLFVAKESAPFQEKELISAMMDPGSRLH